MATIKQKIAFEKSVENGGSLAEGMREAGYSETTINNPQNLTKSDGWKELLETYLPDSLLSQKHKELLNQKQVQRFIFPTRMKDDEIIETVNEAGFKVITIRPSPMGKMAFYSIDNSKAIKDGLDMAYKLKGSYAPDKSININLNETISDERLLEIANKLNETARISEGETDNTRGSISSDGVDSNVVDAEI